MAFTPTSLVGFTEDWLDFLVRNRHLRLRELPLAAIIGDDIPFSPPIVDVSLKS
jgi:hypothetical protein